MELIIITAISENNVIGNNGEIPWKISEDLKRFKQLTLNHDVIMGRKTYQSIINKLGHPLTERKNIVLTRNPDFNEHGIYVAHSIDDVAKLVGSNSGYVIGGESVYREFLPYVNQMEITKVHTNVEGDAYFPIIDLDDDWTEFYNDQRDGFSFHSYFRRMPI